MTNGNKKLLLIGVLFVAVSVIASLFHGNYYLNTSSSVPIGLYRKEALPEKLSKGQFVLLFVPENLKQFLYSSGGFPKRWKLLKQIGGVEGDSFKIENGKFYINNKFIGNVHKTDSKGRAIPGIEPNKKQIVKSGNVLLVATGLELSFDSRYFGEVGKENIIGIATPIFIMNDKY